MKEKQSRDPIASFEREARAARRAGEGSCCIECGENRPLALIRESEPRICAKCQRRQLGKENVDEGMVHSDQNVYTEYADPRQSEWVTKIQPVLKSAKLKELVTACGGKPSRREIIELRAGRSKPHRKTQESLMTVLKALGKI